MSQLDDRVPQLGYVEPLNHESISHYLGRLRRFKANSLPSAYSLGQAAGIGGIISRWENLYFNPFPTEEDETYDDYYVWHGFNRVLERELRENVVDPATQKTIDSLVRLYDPRFPLSEIDPKPIDLNLPSIHKNHGSKELPEDVQAWLNFEGEELRIL